MAETNPLLKAYPYGSPECSSAIYCIAGIRTTVYGLEELRKPKLTPPDVVCLWLLHPRLQAQDCMLPVASSAINAWNSFLDAHNSDLGLPGLIAVTFDQRNHGSREIDPLANQDWRSGNETHAQDMFASYQGTARDTSQLIDYLPTYIFPRDEKRVSTNMVCGISLGGHAAWQCLFQEPRISAGISIIGCPDYTRLMRDRARLSKLDSYLKGTFAGSKDFPKPLIDAIDTYDPAAMTFKDICTLHGTDFDVLDFTSNKETLTKRVRATIHGKQILNMSGGDDKLVPYRCSRPFIHWLSTLAKSPSDGLGCAFSLDDKIYDGVGHSMSTEMARDLDRFIIKTLSQLDCTKKSYESKI